MPDDDRVLTGGRASDSEAEIGRFKPDPAVASSEGTRRDALGGELEASSRVAASVPDLQRSLAAARAEIEALRASVAARDNALAEAGRRADETATALHAARVEVAFLHNALAAQEGAIAEAKGRASAGSARPQKALSRHVEADAAQTRAQQVAAQRLAAAAEAVRAALAAMRGEAVVRSRGDVRDGRV